MPQSPLQRNLKLKPLRLAPHGSPRLVFTDLRTDIATLRAQLMSRYVQIFDAQIARQLLTASGHA